MQGAQAGDFNCTVQPAATIAAGNSSKFTIVFKASLPGLRTVRFAFDCKVTVCLKAIVSISDNDPRFATFSFALKGVASGPPVVVLAGSHIVLNQDASHSIMFALLVSLSCIDQPSCRNATKLLFNPGQAYTAKFTLVNTALQPMQLEYMSLFALVETVICRPAANQRVTLSGQCAFFTVVSQPAVSGRAFAFALFTPFFSVERQRFSPIFYSLRANDARTVSLQRLSLWKSALLVHYRRPNQRCASCCRCISLSVQIAALLTILLRPVAAFRAHQQNVCCAPDLLNLAVVAEVRSLMCLVSLLSRCCSVPHRCRLRFVWRLQLWSLSRTILHWIPQPHTNMQRTLPEYMLFNSRL